MTAKGKVFILSGPSGSGKTTLYKKLLKASVLKKNLQKIVSATTRQPRPGEKHGLDYFFLSPRMFAYKKSAGHFLESQKVFDHHYGTPQKSVRDTLRRAKNVLLCIDVRGARTVRSRFPDAVSIFIKTPNFQILKERLVSRGSEKDATVRLRLETARKELREAGRYDYVLVNRNLAECYAQLEEIVRKELENG